MDNIIINWYSMRQRRTYVSSPQKTSLTEFRETFGQQLEGVTMTTRIIDYRNTMTNKFRLRLSTLLDMKRHGKLIMQHNGVDFAVTKNARTYGTDYVTTASFHLIGSIGDKAIIVYVTEHDAHFGLYDEEMETCLPIDIHELTHTWLNEQTHYQRNKLIELSRHLDELVRVRRTHQ